METFIKGLLVSGGLIIAIGAQNSYVLRQGLLKQNVFWVCLACFLCDFVLMTLGVLGVGALLASQTLLSALLAWGGGLFLLRYGFNGFISAWRGGEALEGASTLPTPPSATKAVTATLALTLLNPHVYIDTIMVIGGVSSALTAQQKPVFLLGSLAASFLWFAGLGYGARLLQPLFKSTKAWIVLDILTGVLMWLIAWGLLHHAVLLTAEWWGH